MTDEETKELPQVDAPLDETLAEDDEWPVRGPSKGIRLAVPTAALIAVALVAAGFWGGSTLEKNHGSSSGGGAGANAAAFLSRLRGATGASGATGATGATGAAGTGGFSFPTSAATGTISVVDGNVLYVLTSSGSLVKVTLGTSTSVTRNAKSTAVGLRPGDAVVVQGSTARNGDVTASSVAATAPGVSSTGGFGGLGGRGGGGFAGRGSGGSGGTSGS
jgi:hypothetical protein